MSVPADTAPAAAALMPTLSDTPALLAAKALPSSAGSAQKFPGAAAAIPIRSRKIGCFQKQPVKHSPLGVAEGQRVVAGIGVAVPALDREGPADHRVGRDEARRQRIVEPGVQVEERAALGEMLLADMAARRRAGEQAGDVDNGHAAMLAVVLIRAHRGRDDPHTSFPCQFPLPVSPGALRRLPPDSGPDPSCPAEPRCRPSCVRSSSAGRRLRRR